MIGKLVTSNARLMSHHLNEKLDESGQSCFEETRVTMADFAKKFDVLSESIKFMSATSFFFLLHSRASDQALSVIEV